ncbi:MAG: alpha/beta hydrolase [Oleibacter sp.]|nr:alpha/beta hydrolase [Thalassolituus sp.]
MKITTLLPLLALVSSQLLSGCSAKQQDDLLQTITEWGREHSDLTLHSAQAEDVEMSYLERRRTGPTLVMLHGFSANKDTWLHLAADLPEDYTLFAPDFAGHGDSSIAADGNYDLEKQVERLHALLEMQNLEQFHLAGNSMGGAIATLYAMKYPEEIKSLILIDAAGVDGKNKSPFFTMLEKGENVLIATDKESFERRMDLILEKPPLIPWPIRPALVRMTINNAEINKEIFADMMATRERLKGEDYRLAMSKELTMPVQILWGSDDHILDVSAVDEFKRYLPQAEVVIFDGIGHVPMVEAPGKTADAVTDFVGRHL